MTSVEKLYPANAAKNPDNVLEQSIGLTQDVLVVGYDVDGEFFAACSEGLADGGNMLWLIEHLKMKLLNGDFDAGN